MKYQSSYDEGHLAENAFQKLAENKGYTVKMASTSQNIEEHWDLAIQKDGVLYTVDVKGAKRNRREDKYVQNEFVWIELRNVHGKPGWLYGKADVIAFEIKGEFWLVKRNSLVQLVDKLVNKSRVASHSGDALYKVYTRKGRQDQISKIRALDLKPIVWQQWT